VALEVKKLEKNAFNGYGREVVGAEVMSNVAIMNGRSSEGRTSGMRSYAGGELAASPIPRLLTLYHD
jgi:hypothetical protein